MTDKYKRTWNLTAGEKCPVCGQPDSCGDCNHAKLSLGDVLALDGTPSMEEIVKLKTMPDAVLSNFIKKTAERFAGLEVTTGHLMDSVRKLKSPRYFTSSLAQ
jgi:hypothetical protein